MPSYEGGAGAGEGAVTGPILPGPVRQRTARAVRRAAEGRLRHPGAVTLLLPFLLVAPLLMLATAVVALARAPRTCPGVGGAMHQP